MDEKLLDNWNMIYENSEDISLHAELMRPGEKVPSIVHDVTTEQLKRPVGTEKVFHLEIDGGCYELIVHAVKDNLVYVRLSERTSEHGWKPVLKKVLSKRDNGFIINLVYFNKPFGSLLVYVKEWGKLKRDTVL